MKILVTGGAGFIGLNLCKKLLQEGHTVCCLDNFVTGSLARAEKLRSHYPRHMFILTKNVLDRFTISGIDFDQVYHLACPASPVQYQRQPIDTLLTSVMGSYNALEFAAKHDATILLASTSEVYGDPDRHPQKEDYNGNVNITGPRACYDEGKRAAETLFCDHNRQWGTKIRIARIFNTYGPGMAVNDGRVISNFITQALMGRPITIYGDGSQTRSFCYVDDTVEALVRLMNSNYMDPVNIGSQDEVSIYDIARRICEKIGGTLETARLPQDDPKQRRPDTGLAEAVIRWSATTPFEEGINKTIDYFREITSGEK